MSMLEGIRSLILIQTDSGFGAAMPGPLGLRGLLPGMHPTGTAIRAVGTPVITVTHALVQEPAFVSGFRSRRRRRRAGAFRSRTLQGRVLRAHQPAGRRMDRFLVRVRSRSELESARWRILGKSRDVCVASFEEFGGGRFAG